MTTTRGATLEEGPGVTSSVRAAVLLDRLSARDGRVTTTWGATLEEGPGRARVTSMDRDDVVVVGGGGMAASASDETSSAWSWPLLSVRRKGIRLSRRAFWSPATRHCPMGRTAGAGAGIEATGAPRDSARGGGGGGSGSRGAVPSVCGCSGGTELTWIWATTGWDGPISPSGESSSSESEEASRISSAWSKESIERNKG